MLSRPRALQKPRQKSRHGGSRKAGARPASGNTPPAAQRRPGSGEPMPLSAPRPSQSPVLLSQPDHLPSHRTTPQPLTTTPQTQEAGLSWPQFLVGSAWEEALRGERPPSTASCCFWRRLIRGSVAPCSGPWKSSRKQDLDCLGGSLCPRRGPCSQATRPHQLCAPQAPVKPEFPGDQ